MSNSGMRGMRVATYSTVQHPLGPARCSPGAGSVVLRRPGGGRVRSTVHSVLILGMLCWGVLGVLGCAGLSSALGDGNAGEVLGGRDAG